MKTQVKAQKNNLPCDFPTISKQQGVKGHKLCPSTLYALARYSDPGHLYVIIARPIDVAIPKNPTLCAIKATDETWTATLLYSLHNNSDWLHAVKEGEYYQFVVHCRRSVEREQNQLYIEKINKVTDHNQITYHLLRALTSERTFPSIIASII